MSLYIGANYHPHDWDAERWKTDIDLMREAGFNMVRLGHLCWDSYEPEEGVYEFAWFDRVMDLCKEAGLGVILDVSMRPAPSWVHRLCPGCNIYGRDGSVQPSIRRYMEDVADPAYQYYALRFAKVLTERYREHPALFGFGLCNEIGDGFRSYGELSRQRFVQWLRKKYGTVENLNRAWAARRWSRKLNDFQDVVFPENDLAVGAPECWLDMRRFFSDGIGEFFVKLKETVEETAPGVPHSSNHYAEKNNLGFDYMKYCDRLDTYPGMGFYPGYQVGEKTHFLMSTYMERLAETDKPMWCLEFQSGSKGLQHGPYGAVRMMAMLCLMRRAQMILGWTWRSMLAGEEQYLCGILGHDGCKSVNYREYGQLASDMKKLEAYAFPYLPVPDVAVAYSYDSDWVIQYAPHHYRQSYRQIMVEVEKTFFALNRDYNIVSPASRKHDYKVMILPGYVVMSKADADSIRRFTAEGGTVIMTAYSAMVDADGQVFSVPRPGLLDDVFGVRVAGFDRTDSAWNFTAGSRIVEDDQGRHELLKIEAAEPFYIDVDYYEELELTGAESVADFGGKGLCAVSVHSYGLGKAYYLAAETNAELLRWLLEFLTDSLGLKRGLSVPEGIQARQIAENQYFYVNTTDKEVRIPLAASRYGVLGEKQWQGELTLQPYGAELVV